MRAVEEQAKLPFKQEVSCKRVSQADVRDYIIETIERKSMPGRLEYEGEALKLLGAIPVNYDYVPELIKLYTRSLAAFYDPDVDYFIIPRTNSEGEQRSIFTHELTHALHDQYFHLEQIIDWNESTDVQLARLALLEGEAMRVMLSIDGEVDCLTTDPVKLKKSVAHIDSELESWFTQESDDAPLYLTLISEFPYLLGLRFVCAVLENNGRDLEALYRVFTKLPSGTSEVMEPTRYGRDEYLSKPPPPDPDVVYSDRLGEFGVFALLRTYLPLAQALRAAAGWSDDRLTLTRSPKGYSLRWETVWQSPEEAEEFERRLRESYEVRFQKNNTQVPHYKIAHRGELVVLSVSH